MFIPKLVDTYLSYMMITLTILLREDSIALMTIIVMIMGL